MSNDKYIEVDIETFGTGHGSSIVSVGAVVFDKDGLAEEFYMTCTRESCKSLGLTEDPSTVKWWEAQSSQAKREWQNATNSIEDVLEQFSAWLSSIAPWRNRVIWCRGAGFDAPLLEDAYELAGMKTPWAYYNVMCDRTISKLYPEIPMPRTGTYHNALDDAKTQALHAIEILKHIEATRQKPLSTESA